MQVVIPGLFSQKLFKSSLKMNISLVSVIQENTPHKRRIYSDGNRVVISMECLASMFKGWFAENLQRWIFFVFLFIHLVATNVTEQLCAYVQLYAYMQHLSVKKMAPSEVKVWRKIFVEDRLREKRI